MLNQLSEQIGAIYLRKLRSTRMHIAKQCGHSFEILHGNIAVGHMGRQKLLFLYEPNLFIKSANYNVSIL